MPEPESKCPLCGWDANIAHLPDIDFIKCELCGEFKITESLQATVFPEDLRPFLRAYIRQANGRRDVPVLHTRNWIDFALAHKSTPLSRKVTKVLELIALRSTPGQPVVIHPAADAPLVDAESSEEMGYLLSHLVKMGYLRDCGSRNYLMEVQGWEQMETGNTAGFPGKCFIAMSFDVSLQSAYDEGIALAVKEDCKMEPIRMDRVEHNEKICDKIIVDIRACQFLIADVTLQRPGVY